MSMEEGKIKDVYALKEGKWEGKDNLDRWVRIGIGFQKRDNSIEIVLDHGRILIQDRVCELNKKS